MIWLLATGLALGAPDPEAAATTPAVEVVPAPPSPAAPTATAEEARDDGVAAGPAPFRAPLPHGGGAALALGLVAAGLLGAGAAAARASAGLRESGVLAGFLDAAAGGARVVAALFGAGAVVALLPESVAAVAPYAVAGAALAVGWSARDVLPDLVARVLVASEGRPAVGSWIRGATFEGRVLRIGARATRLVDRRGRRVTVPNRSLLDHVLLTIGPHPETEVGLRLPGVAPDRARAALVEAALLSPWIAPGARPEVSSDPVDGDRWVLRMRLVDLRFEDPFAGTLGERVSEALGAPSPSPDQVPIVQSSQKS